MKRLGLSLFIFALTACGGGSGSDSVDGNPAGGDQGGGDPSGGSAQAIDCSADKSERSWMPVPEYAGSYSAYEGDYSSLPSGGGLDPENFVGIAQLSIVLMVSNSEEGMMHPGPRWTSVDAQLTQYLDYSHNAEGEIWTFTKHGVDGDGTEFSQHVDFKLEQPANCGYNEYHYEDDGSLASVFKSSKYEWTMKTYDAGTQTGLIETEIQPDRSGRTVSQDFESSSDYPVTIMSWDQNGENILLEYCKTAAGSDCVSSTAP